MIVEGATDKSVGTIRVRKARVLDEFVARSLMRSPGDAVSTITRYSPEFVLQMQIGRSPLADLLQRFGNETQSATDSAAEFPEPPRRPDPAMKGKYGATYRAGEIVICAAPDGGMLTEPELAVFLSEVQDVRPAAPVIGHIDDLPALRRIVRAVEGYPVSGELLSTTVTATVTVA